MYYLLAILAGVCISTMVSLNGELTVSYGAYGAAAIVHAVGVIFALILCRSRKEHFNLKSKVPLWVYCGGAVGVFTTLFNNYAFGQISMTSIVAMGLLGQSIASVLFDHFGFFGIEKRKIHKSAIIGYIAALIGVIVMLDKSASGSVLAIILTFLAGCNVVLSRTINSKLSLQTSPLIGSLINHAVGLPICIIFFLLLQKSFVITNISVNPWKYLGGTLGVMGVLLFNITVPRISAFRLTLLSFTGQIFTGIIIDMIIGTEQSIRTILGGLIVAVGLTANMVFEQWQSKKNAALPADTSL